MSTDIATRDDEHAPIAAETSALVLWAFEASKAHKIAQSLAKTSFVPQSMQGRPDDITAAILAGHELGLKPMAALRSMDIIQGTPALRAHAMRALIQSQGHQVQLLESTETRCKMRGRRNGDVEWQDVLWTIERAQRLGLAGKDQWKKQPQAMLVARATGELCRLVAADALYAMPYAAEELSDDLGPVVATASVEKPKRTIQRKALPAAIPEPELEEYMPSDTSPAEPEPTGDTPPEPALDDDGWPEVAKAGGAP